MKVQATALRAGRGLVDQRRAQTLAAPPPTVCVQRLKGEVDLENYENIPVPKPKQLPDEDDD